MDPFLGEIRMFSGTFAPRGWAFCNGSLIPISQNTALFALLGTQFGGDGRSTFALPNLLGRAPVGQGQGPGLSSYTIGESTGEANHTLTTAEMASHAHSLTANKSTADNATPVGNMFGSGGTRSSVLVFAPTTSVANMAANIVGGAGGSQPHNNMQPYQVVNYIIALQGIFPQRQ